MPGLDQLGAILEERQATSFDIHASREELMEEIDLADYIQTMLIAPFMEARVLVPTVSLMEPILTSQPSEASPIHAVDKGKGTYAKKESTSN